MFSCKLVLFVHLYLVTARGVLTQSVTISRELDNLESEVTQLARQLDDSQKDWEWTDDEIVWLKQDLDRLTISDSPCTPFWQYDCGTRCVAYYLLCDGYNDCPQGQDETPGLCHMFLKEGDEFDAIRLGTNTYFGFGIYEWKIPKIIIHDYFPSVPEVKSFFPVTLPDGASAVVIPHECFYHYGLRRLFMINYNLNFNFYVFEPSREVKGMIAEQVFTRLYSYQDSLTKPPFVYFVYTPKEKSIE